MWMKRISLILTIIGALNWGLVGAFNFDLVTFIFGSLPIISRLIYIIIGISSVVVAFSLTCKIKQEEE